jgi:hypothetical protein
MAIGRYRMRRAPSSPFVLDSFLADFWEETRASAPYPSIDPFAWWPGKLCGDSRSFAQVVASPPNPRLHVDAASPSTLMGGHRGGFDGNRCGGGGAIRDSNLGQFECQNYKNHLAAGESQWERRIMDLIAGRQLMHVKFMHELCGLLIYISIY